MKRKTSEMYRVILYFRPTLEPVYWPKNFPPAAREEKYSNEVKRNTFATSILRGRGGYGHEFVAGVSTATVYRGGRQG
ncbi:hypothetical protein TNCV_2031011 [Trichonephila clavipes]|nr:hypothetical protein TNCV_2031011 [Trichonephila clavipes]